MRFRQKIPKKRYQKKKLKKDISPKDSQEEVSKKETVQQLDLQKKEPKQITLTDGSYGQKARSRCKEEVKSLLTIKNDVSPKDSQDRVSKKEAKKEDSLPKDSQDEVSKKETVKKDVLPKEEVPEDTTIKDRRTDQTGRRHYKEETDQQLDFIVPKKLNFGKKIHQELPTYRIISKKG